jgi:hypothetical protein
MNAPPAFVTPVRGSTGRDVRPPAQPPLPLTSDTPPPRKSRTRRSAQTGRRGPVHARESPASSRLRGDSRQSGADGRLLSACATRTEAGVVLALDGGGSVRAGDTREQRGPLQYCAWRGTAGLRPSHVPAGADVDARDVPGQSAPHSAALGGHVDSVQCLIDLGADAAVARICGQPPVELSASPLRLTPQWTLVLEGRNQRWDDVRRVVDSLESGRGDGRRGRRRAREDERGRPR